MAFPFIQVAAASLIGWWLYRSYQTRGPAVQARPKPEPSRGGKAGSQRTAAPKAASTKDDLGRVKGIGPGIASLLNDAGITTWAQLAAAEVSDLREILDRAGPRYRVHDPSTWPEQAAELAGAN